MNKTVDPEGFDADEKILEDILNDPDYPSIYKKVQYEEITERFEAAADKKKPFFKRVKNFFTGRSKLGSKVGAVIDTATIFLPYGREINTGRDLLVSVIAKKEERKRKPMLKKVLSLKNFVNVKDGNGNISIEEIGASAIQLVIAFGVVWGAVELGIWEELVEFMNSERATNSGD